MAKLIPHLKRYPEHSKDLLQAWDSADELILDHLKTQDLSAKRILVMNDAFGAISSTLAHALTATQSPPTPGPVLDTRRSPGSNPFLLTSYTDSFVSAEGIQRNTEGALTPISNLDALSGLYDLVLMKVPKNLSFFEDQLCHLSGHLHPQSKLVCGAMIKHLPKSAFDLLQKYVGSTSTSLAAKKARLIFAGFEKEKVKSPYPVTIAIESFKFPFVNESNLFSREKLDIGTRFFLSQIPTGNFQTILDLGCANGVVGIRAKQLNPRASIIFCDDSAMAVKSASVNYEMHCKGANEPTEFFWTNCYERGQPNSVDLVLCNPPFHQHQTVGDFIARQMFRDAFTTLRPGGLLRIIGNSNLGYELQLKKLFGKSTLVAKNAKFVVIDAIKSA
jgi:23S rRNA (guanine1835-N2)-methyltransferase